MLGNHLLVVLLLSPILFQDPSPVFAAATQALGESPGKTLSAASADLDRLNLSRLEIREAVEQFPGQARDDRMVAASKGYPHRLAVLRAAAAAYDRLLRSVQADGQGSKPELAVDSQTAQWEVADLNVSAVRVRRLLESSSSEAQTKLKELRAKSSDYPARSAALDNLIRAWNEDSAARATSTDRRLGFHLLVEGDELRSPSAAEMVRQLENDSHPDWRRGNGMRWYEVTENLNFAGEMRQRDNRKWILVWTTPDRQMVANTKDNAWKVESADRSVTERGLRAVHIRLDATGGDLLKALTTNNMERTVAIALGEELVFVGTIRSPISRDIILAREEQYSLDELEQMIEALSSDLPDPNANSPE